MCLKSTFCEISRSAEELQLIADRQTALLATYRASTGGLRTGVTLWQATDEWTSSTQRNLEVIVAN